MKRFKEAVKNLFKACLDAIEIEIRIRLVRIGYKLIKKYTLNKFKPRY